MKVSIILPAKNEEKIIGKCIKDITKYLRHKGYSYELIVVLNGCGDSTEPVVRKEASKNSRIKLLISKPGYGVALRKGMKEARGEYIVIYNVDFYDFNAIELISVNLLGKDLLLGSKTTYWSIDKREDLRKYISFFYNLFLKFVFGFKGSDTHGIKVMKREVVHTILKKCKINNGIFDSEFVIKAQRQGFKIADFAVEIEEIRESRFVNRLFSTPLDIYNLYKALK